MSGASRHAKDVEILFLDVDGTLTDGRVYLGGDAGGDFRAFHVHDGMGIRLVLDAGIKVALVSAGESVAVARRARMLGIEIIRQGVEEKLSVFHDVIAEEGVAAERAAYMGDDVNDLPSMGAAGYVIAPANARPEVRDAADLVTTAAGGHGAVREACEWLLKERGKG